MSTNLEDSVVLITSSNPKYQNIIGTGFVIYREAETSYLLTCAHVVEAVGGKDNVQIYGKPATVIASSDVNDFDLAVIQVKHQKLINRPVLKLQNYSQEGTSVKAAGYYLYSEEKKRSLATIEGVLGRQKYREDQDTGERAIAWEININNEDQLQKGYSGSPVVDQDSGLVIGVVTNMGTGGQIGEIISIEALEIICPLLIEKINQPPKLEVELKSEKNVDYTKLEKLLAEGKWKEADQETAKVMCQASGRESEGWLRVEDIDNFPCEDLRTTNQLWLQYSKGKFGFSVQKEIYESFGGTREYNEEVWEKFCNSVGWKSARNRRRYSSLRFNHHAPFGHLPMVSLGYFFHKVFQGGCGARGYGTVCVKSWESSSTEHNEWRWGMDYGEGYPVCSEECMAMAFGSLLSRKDLVKLDAKIAYIDYIRSEISSLQQILADKEKGVDYTKLRDLLAAKKWKDADQETRKVMCQAVYRTRQINCIKKEIFSLQQILATLGNKEKNFDYNKLSKFLDLGELLVKLSKILGELLAARNWESEGEEKLRLIEEKDINNFPCEDLQTINQLWLDYSKGKFGFSVQKEIYESLGGTREYNQEVWEKFGDSVGWRKGGKWLTESDITFDLELASHGHLPSFRACGQWNRGENIGNYYICPWPGYIICYHVLVIGLLSRTKTCDL